ncbi:MAG: DUF3180 domain-containing protein [Spirochaetaceae bacterium]|nr:DUF3180 domain-containing protein [Spirochaetaceae bacterium]
MRFTRISTLVALLLGVAALTWGVLRVVETQGAALPPLTWTAPAGVALLAVVVLVTAVALRRRLASGRPPDPLGMARMAVLGKASAHVGPIVGGLYAGYLVVLLPDLEIESRREGAVLCGVALLAAVLLTAAGLLLERACRVRGGQDPLEPEVPAT